MGCGMFFCRHRDSVAQAFRSDVTYMPARPVSEDAASTFNPLTQSAQWSRRFIGLKLFMALAEHGEAGYAEMLDHQVRMGNLLRESLTASGWRIANSTPFPVICFTREGVIPSDLRRRASRTSDRLDVRRGTRRHSGHPRLHHQLQNHRGRHRVGR